MGIKFKHLKDLATGEVSTDAVQYTDEAGAVWTIPLGVGHRFEDLLNTWLSQGNTVEPLDAPEAPQVPQVVSRFQAKAALLGAGMLDQVEALMVAPETPVIYKLAWVEAQDFQRHSPTVSALSQSLGLTDAQLDQLFISAAGITA